MHLSSDAMIRLASLVAFAVLATAASARAEICTDLPPGQSTPNATVSVSSVLKPQGSNTYGPENLRGDTDKAWCEGAPGAGQGEYVRIGWSQPIAFRAIVIGNGYQKSRETYFNNARARTVRIETGDGLSFAAELPDSGQHHTIRLPRTANTNSLRLTVVDVYRGDKYGDLCLFYLAPKFDELN